jgi:hypothetical protein
MKYLCLAYHDEQKFEALPKTELDAIGIKCKSHDEEIHKGGHLILVGSLAPTRTTTSLRPRNGKVLITDGPSRPKSRWGRFSSLRPRT